MLLVMVWAMIAAALVFVGLRLDNKVILGIGAVLVLMLSMVVDIN